VSAAPTHADDPWARVDAQVAAMCASLDSIAASLQRQAAREDQQMQELTDTLIETNHTLGTTRRMVEAVWSRVDDLEARLPS